jgi:hypothetical protein
MAELFDSPIDAQCEDDEESCSGCDNDGFECAAADNQTGATSPAANQRSPEAPATGEPTKYTAPVSPPKDAPGATPQARRNVSNDTLSRAEAHKYDPVFTPEQIAKVAKQQRELADKEFAHLLVDLAVRSMRALHRSLEETPSSQRK